jgi:alcohol-forming fatty acyl-CoA reductase
MSSPVKEFYVDKTVLLTGGFGSIGKLMISKLLRLNVVKEILLIARQRKGKSTQERLDKLFNGFLFQDMATFDPKFRQKVKIINGDMELPDIGFSDEDRQYMKSHVEVFIHGAASLNMEGKLSQTIATNVRGTKVLLDLALEMKQLQSFVFISTAYSQYPLKYVEEVFYKPPIGFRDLINLLEHFKDDEMLDILTAKLIDGSTNIYTFSKAVTEDMIKQYQDKLPVAVVRPSQGENRLTSVH